MKKLIKEEFRKYPGAGVDRKEDVDSGVLDRIKKYFNYSISKWDIEKMKADGLIDGEIKEPIKEPIEEPIEEPTREPVSQPESPQALPPITPTKPEVDTKEVGELTEQLQRMRKLMGM
jgi:hypothetical protein